MTRRSIWLLALALALPLTTNAADLVDAATLRKQGEAATTLPVVDGRDVAERSMLAVPGALVYERGLAVMAAKILVIADIDDDAFAIARLLEASNPGLTALALVGGYDTLRELRPTANLPARGGMPSFTIPSDTCQPGPALHTYEGR